MGPTWPNLYRTVAFLKDISTIITASLKGRAVILVISYVKTFYTDIIVVIGNVTMCLMSQ